MSVSAAMRQSVPARQRVEALLACKIESRLAGDPSGVGAVEVPSAWDVWWMCCRAGMTAAELGMDPHRAPGPCRSCVQDVSTLTAAHPVDAPARRQCDCLDHWAKELRRPVHDAEWPPLRTHLAMTKPGTDSEDVRRVLQQSHEIVHETVRQLSTADARRLYPDAYGAEWIARQDAYLTSGPVHVFVLVAVASASIRPKEMKSRIRSLLGPGDPLCNHIHMPDNPGDALCDIDHLAGPDVLYELYDTYDRDRAHHRLAHYLDLLARR